MTVVVVEAGFILSPVNRETVLLSLGGVLPTEIEKEIGADAGVGPVLVEAVIVVEGQRFGTVTAGVEV